MHTADSEQPFAYYLAWRCGGVTTYVVKSGGNIAVEFTEQIQSQSLHII
jgi:hypothetical protein